MKKAAAAFDTGKSVLEKSIPAALKRYWEVAIC